MTGGLRDLSGLWAVACLMYKEACSKHLAMTCRWSKREVDHSLTPFSSARYRKFYQIKGHHMSWWWAIPSDDLNILCSMHALEICNSQYPQHHDWTNVKMSYKCDVQTSPPERLVRKQHQELNCITRATLSPDARIIWWVWLSKHKSGSSTIQWGAVNQIPDGNLVTSYPYTCSWLTMNGTCTSGWFWNACR